MRLPAWPRERIELQVKNIARLQGRPGLLHRMQSIEAVWKGGSQKDEPARKPTENEMLWHDLMKRAYDELPTTKEKLGFDMDDERKAIIRELAQRKRIVLSPAQFRAWAKNVRRAV